MGMFDNVLWKDELPTTCPEDSFQTKSFGCFLDWYKVEGGVLYRFIDGWCMSRLDLEDNDMYHPTKHTGEMVFYTGGYDPHEWYEYVALFDSGKLIKVVPWSED